MKRTNFADCPALNEMLRIALAINEEERKAELNALEDAFQDCNNPSVVQMFVQAHSMDYEHQLGFMKEEMDEEVLQMYICNHSEA